MGQENNGKVILKFCYLKGEETLMYNAREYVLHLNLLRNEFMKVGKKIITLNFPERRNYARICSHCLLIILRRNYIFRKELYFLMELCLH